MEQLGWPDIAIALLVTVSLIIGIFRGFVKELISLITWISAIVAATIFSDSLSGYMSFTDVKFIQTAFAFFLIFTGVVLSGAILNYIIGKWVKESPFTGADRVLGAGFGVIRGILVVAIVVLLAGLTSAPETPWWRSSYAVHQFEGIAVWAVQLLPENYAKAFKFSDKIATASAAATTAATKFSPSEITE